MMKEEPINKNAIAIIGMSGRFPGASSIDEFWNNLCNGVEAISHFSDQELLATGIPLHILQRPEYVKAGAVLEDIALFDAAFFDISPRDAAIMDPQQRLFLECAWEALEVAGYDTERTRLKVGVFAGAGINTYRSVNLANNRSLLEKVDDFQISLGNEKDYLATRISYKLNLRGPSVSVSCACSTSLVAVHMGVQSLLNGECDLILAGGVAIQVPHKEGYLYQEGGIVSPDGHCRAFDQHAQGTVRGNGVGVVLLKRLKDAIEDGDTIHAIIKGSAVNNDGFARAGFTAPGVEGQVDVITEAQAIAEVDPAMITYIEAHGTGTELGDPLEVEALTQVFRASTQERNFCALGSVKTNVGHLDAAAGVTGLIKAVLALKYQKIPPSLNFNTPNPRIDFEHSPFYVNKHLMDWKSDGKPRIAGVSSFGIGGTNAHIILQEAPSSITNVQGNTESPCELFVLSAKSLQALDAVTSNLKIYLQQHTELVARDVAYTLQVGRRQFDHRRAFICHDLSDAVQTLEILDPQLIVNGTKQESHTELAFMFPGQGSQFVHMGAELYRHAPVFRECFDRCALYCQDFIQHDLRELLYPELPDKETESRYWLDRTEVTQPALFSFEYALAQQWIAWGVRPKALIGHSIGEFVAACLAGVFSLEDALRLVVRRGEMMQALPAGSMLAIQLSQQECTQFLNEHISLAAVNGVERCVVSGTTQAIAQLQARLDEQGVICRLLHTSHAFHSWAMDPIITKFTDEVKRITLKLPRLPFISNVSGTWIKPEEAVDPHYWGEHIRATVLFSAGLQELLNEPGRVLLEVGPGTTLTTMARLHAGKQVTQTVYASLPRPKNLVDALDFVYTLRILSQLWAQGVPVNWLKFANGKGQHVPLPTYPFERTRHWIEADHAIVTHHPISPPGQTLATQGESNQVVEEGAIMQSAAQHSALYQVIEDNVKDIFALLLGLNVKTLDGNQSFFEVGADSLLLLQASQKLKEGFGVKVPFRLMLDEYPTFNALSRYLEEHISDEYASRLQVQEKAPALEALAIESSTMPVDVPLLSTYHTDVHTEDTYNNENDENNQKSTQYTASSGTGLENVMVQQLRIMSQLAEQQHQLMGRQLEVLNAGSHVLIGPKKHDPIARPIPITDRVTNHVIARDLLEPAPFGGNGEIANVASLKIDSETFVAYTPIQKKAIKGVTVQQQSYIDSVVERIARKTGGSKMRAQRYRRYLADNRGSAGFNATFKEMIYPLTVTHAEDAHIWDVDGNKYIDVAMGFGALLFGHSPVFIQNALKEQTMHGLRLGLQSDVVGETAKLMCELTGNERVAFCNSGTEAVMTALRLARTVTGRPKIALFAGAFHGTFDGVLVRALEDAQHNLRTAALSPGIPPHMIEDVIILNFGQDEALQTLKEHAHELAAVLVELPQSRRPDLQPTQFLRRLRALTSQEDIALIFDEVISGFRIHPAGAQAIFGVQADLIAYGKAMGGGLPVSAVAGKAKFMSAIDGGLWEYGDTSSPEEMQTFFAGTYFKHPLLVPVIHAILQHLKESGPALQEDLNARTTDMVQRLNHYFEQLSLPIRVVQFGSLFRFMFPAIYKSAVASLFFGLLLDKGIYIAETRNCFLSTAHTDDDIEQFIRAVQETIEELIAEDFLVGEPPKPPDGSNGSLSRIRVTTPAISSRLNGQVQGGSRAEISTGRARMSEDVYTLPLTEEQKEIWFMCQFGSDAARAYNQSLSLHLCGQLRVSILRQALQLLIDRHEVLRTVFDRDGDTQYVLPAMAQHLCQQDLMVLPEEQRLDALATVQMVEAQHVFDLECGPLLRTHLVTVSEQEHYLIFTVHHIIVDGWSISILLEELTTLYAVLSRGARDTLPHSTPFRDYAAWQQIQQNGAQMADDEAYWLERFSSIPPALALPTDHPRPPIKSYKGAMYRTILDPDIYNALTAAGKRQSTTIFSLLLTTYTILLQRLTGQDDVVVFVPVAGQLQLEDESVLVGHCVNLLPVRIMLRGDQLSDQCTIIVRQALMDAFSHQLYPFTKLVEKLQVPRDPGAMPLGSTSFNLDQQGTLSMGELAVTIEPFFNGFAKFDLALNLVQLSDTLAIECTYNTDLFSSETIQSWMDCFITLLTAIAQEEMAKQRCVDLPILSKEAIPHLFAQLDGGERHDLTGKVFIREFEAQVRQRPQACAVVADAQTLTYQQLDERASVLAVHLQQLGVGPEKLVALLMERGKDLLVSILAIWKAGGAYVPLNLSSPARQHGQILAQSQVMLVLTSEQWQERAQDALAALPATHVRPVCALSSTLQATPIAQSLALVQHDPAQLAYVIYTSGSTGVPKGAMLTQQGMLNHLSAKIEELSITAQDRVAQNTAASFDISIWQLVAALLVGGTVQVIAEEEARDPQQLVMRVQQAGLTLLEMVPSLLQAFLLLREALPQMAPDLTRLRWLVCCGEALAPSVARGWRLAYPHVRLLNAYGPAECSDNVSHYDVQVTPSSQEMHLPIGHALRNLHLFILDDQLHQVPPGAVGELCVAGVGLARGYLCDPVRTASAFLPHPYGQEGERLYRTGDLVRLGPQGVVVYLGRKDTQVKVRGYRIEPGEIEEQLRQMPGVEQVAVIVRTDQAEPRLVAYLVGKGTTAGWKRWLQDRVPVYMVPVAFVTLEQLPLNSNGKVDRRHLPEPDWGGQDDQQGYVAPQSPLEQTLVHIWSEVLNIQGIGRTHNFFELGGHSLLATRVLTRIRQQMPVNLQLHTLFEAPTIADLAARIEQLPQQYEQQSIQEILRRPRPEHLPLSFGQQRLWFLAQMEPDNPFYNLIVIRRIMGPLQIPALRQGLAQMQQRHEILRTTFAHREGQAFQQVHTTLDLSFEVFSCEEQMVQTLTQQEALHPFHLDVGPLWRSRVLRLHEQEHLLLLVFHHSIFDGGSEEIFLRELAVCYEAAFTPGVATLPELPVQYADYALWQQQWLDGDDFSRQHRYWLELLRDAPTVLKLPLDAPRPPVQTYQGAEQRFAVPAVVAERLRQMGQREGATTFMLMMAAYGVLLSRFTGQDDLLVGSPISNRSSIELEPLIGFLVNTLVYRLRLPAGITFRDLLRQVRQSTLEAHRSQEYPFEKLLTSLDLERDLSYSPLIQTLLNVETPSTSTERFADLKLLPADVRVEIAKFDLSLWMAETPKGFVGLWEYNREVFDPRTIAHISDDFQELLEIMSKAPDQAVESLIVRGTVERDAALVGVTWDMPDERCFLSVFEEQVHQRPQANALVDDGQILTYQQLDERASVLAVHLQQLGVGPEKLVALLMERGKDLLVSILAIWKAGGAYLPLNLSSPARQHGQILAQSRTMLVLTSEQWQERAQDALAALPATHVRPVCVLSSTLQATPIAQPLAPVQHDPAQLAYVVYTSGSTGVPKGAMLTQQGMLNHLDTKIEGLSMTAQDRVAQNASASFDISIWQLMAALLVGGTVQIIAEQEARDPQQLVARAQQDGITLLQVVPSLLQAFLLLREALPQMAPDLMRLRWLVSVGEALAPSVARGWRLAYPHVRLLNVYGPAECSDNVSQYEVQMAPRSQEMHLPIGHALRNIQMFILDDQLHLVPPGAVGELCVAGVGLARGYLSDPVRTASAFLPHPYGQEGERLYRTGDLVRLGSQGEVVYLGRKDTQVKVRGYRIELGEIEEQLRQMPGVEQVVVMVRTEQVEPRLVAYVVGEGTTARWKHWLQERVPAYMVPVAFVTLEQLPLNSNGKVDRRHLPEPDWEVQHDQQRYIAPQSPLEQILVHIWSEVLNIQEIGRTHNFFELGGDSIIGVRIVALARARGIMLFPRHLFQHQTIAELAGALQGEPPLQAEMQDTNSVIDGQVPLTLTPIAQWFFAQDLAEPQHWNQSVLLAFPATTSLTPETIRSALTVLLLQHDALRLCYQRGVSGWEFSVGAEPREAPLDVYTLADLNKAQRQEVLRRQATAVQASLDLETGQLLHAAWFDLGAQEPRQLLIAVHHLAVDIFSWQIVLSELQILCEQAIRGEALQLSARTTSYQRWSQVLARYAQQAHVLEELAFWRTRPWSLVRPLPQDLPRGENREAMERTVCLTLTHEETRRLIREFTVRFHVQVHEVVLAALVWAVHQWTHSEVILLDQEGHGREEIDPAIDISGTVGWFTSIVPFCLDLRGCQTSMEGLQAVKEQVRGLREGGISFGLLRYLSDDAQVRQELAALPGAEMVFNYEGGATQGGTGTAFTLSEEDAGAERSPHNRRSHALIVGGALRAQRLELSISYSETMYRRETLARVVSECLDVIRGWLAEPEEQDSAWVMTPSDFPEAELDQEQLDAVMGMLHRPHE